MTQGENNSGGDPPLDIFIFSALMKQPKTILEAQVNSHIHPKKQKNKIFMEAQKNKQIQNERKRKKHVKKKVCGWRQMLRTLTKKPTFFFIKKKKKSKISRG